MTRNRCLDSYIKCGEIYKIDLPNNLDKSQPPIIIGKLDIDASNKKDKGVLIKFSEFIKFSLLGVNPKINITYRLIKINKITYNTQILQEWDFGFETLRVIEFGNVDTSQPTVLVYYDELDDCDVEDISYEFQIVQIKNNNVESFSLVNESITSTFTNNYNACLNNKAPYVSAGTIFNPVLPLRLDKYDRPVLLSKVEINKSYDEELNISVGFSGFVTSVLKNEHVNNLVFRLTRTDKDNKELIIREYPFKRVFTNDTNIREPIVYDYCECLECGCSNSYTYKFELVCANLSSDSYYEITNKNMTIQVYDKK